MHDLSQVPLERLIEAAWACDDLLEQVMRADPVEKSMQRLITAADRGLGDRLPAMVAAAKRTLLEGDPDSPFTTEEAYRLLGAIAPAYLAGLGGDLSAETQALLEEAYDVGLTGVIDPLDIEEGAGGEEDDLLPLLLADGSYWADQSGDQVQEMLGALLLKRVGQPTGDVLDGIDDLVGEELPQRASGYWPVLATVLGIRARNGGTLVGMKRGGVKWYRRIEVMDDLTCKLCRFLHGRKFKVEDGLAQMRDYLEGDREEAVDRHPFPRLKDVIGMSTEELAEAGFLIPPSHPHCRGRLVPVMGGEEESDEGGAEDAGA